ncbi:MAG: hypothetical protein HXS44_09765 [Theionarchaea archaeon]|nr:hypothetical protein [Theionarchaea archaeon]
MKCKVCGNSEFAGISVVTGIDIDTSGGINISLFNVGVESETNVRRVNLKVCKKCGIVYCSSFCEDL